MSRDLSDDFALLDRYQIFSAEVLRLGLLGIGAVGFLIARTGETGALLEPDNMNRCTKLGVLTALGAFALSCALALGHRYFSTDSMACLKKMIDLRGEPEPNQDKISSERASMLRAFDRSTWLIASCALALAFGAAALALAFASAIL